MNALLQHTLSALRAAGFEPQIQQSRHIRVIWTDAHGRKRLIVVARSPSSSFAIKNHRALLRRLLKGGAR